MKVSKYRCLCVCLLLCLVAFLPTGVCAQVKSTGLSKVVIDAGHGGKDPGTTYRQYREKDINLAVGLRLGALIGENYPDVTVVYTRKSDVFVPLFDRGSIANKASADLFISIHVNGAKSSAASGTETFVMGVDKSGKNLDIAMKENDVITYEDDYSAKYQGYTPGSSESFIIFSLMQYSYQTQSLQLANLVQKHYVQRLPMGNRGVKQAGFLVLWNAAMPSILTELGFLSNPSDLKTLTSSGGQEKLARSLFNAFSEYKTKIDGRGSAIVLADRQDDATQGSETTEPESSQRLEPQISNPVAPVVASVPRFTITYRIQVASSDRKIPKNSSIFGLYRGEVTEKVVDGRYKYYVESVASYKDALSLQAKVRKTINGAFVVAFKNDDIIPIDQARNQE